MSKAELLHQLRAPAGDPATRTRRVALARQALGAPGWLLGWMPWFRQKVRGQAMGMVTLDQCLTDLVRKGQITPAEARSKARSPENFPG